MTVLLPFPVERLEHAPLELTYDVWDGHPPLPASARDIELYVKPYFAGQTAVDAIAAMPSLQVIQTQTAGVDHVLSAVPPGVTLCNARGVHDASTAELAVGLMIAAQRGLADFVRAQDAARWEPTQIRNSITDTTVLLLGYGSIGVALERRLLGFEVEMIKVASRPRDGVHGVDALPDLLPRADIVVVLVPLTSATRGLVNVEFLARMRDAALLVNVARGGVVDTDALVTETASGRLRAALDVTDPEPLPPDHPLWRTPGVLITPHVGGASTAMEPRMQRLVVEQLQRYAHRTPLLNVVVAGDRYPSS
jgi:phosphoglycerate dehydrogenase-like enzyme